jgi:hypothetical protein
MVETTVYRTWDESFAEMAVDLLRAEGIEARKVADVPRSIYPITMDGLGEIRVVVQEEDAQEALDILAARFSETDLGDYGDEEFKEDEEYNERYSDDRDTDGYSKFSRDEE